MLSGLMILELVMMPFFFIPQHLTVQHVQYFKYERDKFYHYHQNTLRVLSLRTILGDTKCNLYEPNNLTIMKRSINNYFFRIYPSYDDGITLTTYKDHFTTNVNTITIVSHLRPMLKL